MNRLLSEMGPSGSSILLRPGSLSTISSGMRWRRPNIEALEIGSVNKLMAGPVCLRSGSKGGGCGEETVAGGVVFNR